MVIDHQLNPEKYTKEQLKQNYADAAAAYYADADAAYDAAAAYFAAYTADAADNAAYAIDQYLKHTGENKQEYINAINKDNKQ